MRLLLVEDNSKMSSFIRQGLTEQGYKVDIAVDGVEGERKAIAAPHDAIILDVMLPERDGIQVCRNLRARGDTTPILMLTALSSTGDKVTGLDAGADDYLTKPFEFSEFLARIKALVRRGQSDGALLRFDHIEMDLIRRQVTVGNQRIRITAKEFLMLECFLRSPDRVLTRAEIGQHVWDTNFDPDSNVIDVYVSMLRRKINRDPGHRLIHTVVGKGYMLSQTRPAAT